MTGRSSHCADSGNLEHNEHRARQRAYTRARAHARCVSFVCSACPRSAELHLEVTDRTSVVVRCYLRSGCAQLDLADVVTIGGLKLGEQDAHRGDDASHDQCECNVRVCRLHEIPLKPRLRGSLQRFARLTVLVNGKRFGPKMRRAGWPESREIRAW